MNRDRCFFPHTCHCFLQTGQAEEPRDTWLLLSGICTYAIEEFSFYKSDLQRRFKPDRNITINKSYLRLHRKSQLFHGCFFFSLFLHPGHLLCIKAKLQHHAVVPDSSAVWAGTTILLQSYLLPSPDSQMSYTMKAQNFSLSHMLPCVCEQG